MEKVLPFFFYYYYFEDVIGKRRDNFKLTKEEEENFNCSSVILINIKPILVQGLLPYVNPWWSWVQLLWVNNPLHYGLSLLTPCSPKYGNFVLRFFYFFCFLFIYYYLKKKNLFGVVLKWLNVWNTQCELSRWNLWVILGIYFNKEKF
jgi:hypothetical protein